MIGRARIAELLEDPAWRAARRLKILMRRTGLTAQQVAEIAALRGTDRPASVARRYGVGWRTVVRIWREGPSESS